MSQYKTAAYSENGTSYLMYSKMHQEKATNKTIGGQLLVLQLLNYKRPSILNLSSPFITKDSVFHGLHILDL